MKAVFIFLIVFLGFVFCGKCQNFNVIIEVNDKLITYGGFYDFRFEIKQGDSLLTVPATYVPGNLSIPIDIWKSIDSALGKKVSLRFNYSTYSKGDQDIANFDIDLTFGLLKQPYLIINIFDFRDKKYKHWYQWHTDKSFIAQLDYPGSGILIRK